MIKIPNFLIFSLFLNSPFLIVFAIVLCVAALAAVADATCWTALPYHVAAKAFAGKSFVVLYGESIRNRSFCLLR
jgi:hypothetical protein